MIFWDSSGLVPLLIREPQSAACQSVYATDPAVAVWFFTPVELRSALSRRLRSQEITRADGVAALERMTELAAEWTLIAAFELVRARAERLLDVHSLASADALQLGAALIFTRDSPQGVGFVALDERLRDAAAREGFRVLPGTS